MSRSRRRTPFQAESVLRGIDVIHDEDSGELVV